MEANVSESPSTIRVLLVEDMAPNQRFTVRLLERRGFEVTVAANGRQALEIYDAETAHPFDVIIMDCQMPVMDGFETAKEIRERERASGRYTPIVALTAIATTGQKERCTAAGMDDYLNKPIVEDELVSVIENMRARVRK